MDPKLEQQQLGTQQSANFIPKHSSERSSFERPGTAWDCRRLSGPAQLGYLIFSNRVNLGCVIFSDPAQLGFMSFSGSVKFECVIFSGSAQPGSVIFSGPT